jgi:hypothetical protein
MIMPGSRVLRERGWEKNLEKGKEAAFYEN